MGRTITDKDLAEFTAWYFENFECSETPQVYFTISMAGYLHSYEKETRQLLKRCKAVGLVNVAGGVVKRTGNGIESHLKDGLRLNSG